MLSASVKSKRLTLEDLYNRVTGDEDARVCKDIPKEACADQPQNYFAYLGANLLGKVADEIASAKLVIPWLFGALGVPAAFTGFLVPIREAGVLLPQLAVAAAVRRLAIRKGIWLLGAVLSALSLFGMALAALTLEHSATGGSILLMLVGGLIGLIGDWLGAAATVLIFGLLSLLAAAYILSLPDVSEPA